MTGLYIATFSVMVFLNIFYYKIMTKILEMNYKDSIVVITS